MSGPHFPNGLSSSYNPSPSLRDSDESVSAHEQRPFRPAPLDADELDLEPEEIKRVEGVVSTTFKPPSVVSTFVEGDPGHPTSISIDRGRKSYTVEAPKSFSDFFAKDMGCNPLTRQPTPRKSAMWRGRTLLTRQRLRPIKEMVFYRKIKSPQLNIVK